LVSLYSGGNLEVFDTESATPWVHPDDLRRHGALYVLDDDDAIPAGVTHVIEFDLLAGNQKGRAPRTIKLGILMPELQCE
jgi:hypothetical protein